MWNAIEQGSFPEWKLAVQLFDEDFAKRFDFDVLDATKLIPEQVAFCTSNVVPGINFTNDLLLQGRNFSYLDTQLPRLGSPNFAQIPINQSRCPMHNFQRDEHMQMVLQRGRVSYGPSGLGGSEPHEDARAWFRSFAAH